MATDYDTPRKTDDDVDSDSLEELKARRNDKSTSSVDVDEFEAAEGLELPGADLSNEELAVRVVDEGLAGHGHRGAPPSTSSAVSVRSRGTSS